MRLFDSVTEASNLENKTKDKQFNIGFVRTQKKRRCSWIFAPRVCGGRDGQEGGGGVRMERGRKRSAEEARGEDDEGVVCDLEQEWPQL